MVMKYIFDNFFHENSKLTKIYHILMRTILHVTKSKIKTCRMSLIHFFGKTSNMVNIVKIGNYFNLYLVLCNKHILNMC